MTYHSLDVKEVLKLKDASLQGLSEAEAKRRLLQYGENKLEEEKPTSAFVIFLRQFNEIVVYILVVATIVSFLIKEYLDAYTILAILIFNAFFGTWQEYKAERAVQLLKKLTTLNAKVLRNGEIKEIPSYELIPGDIVLVEAGDKVPADIRLIEAKNLQTNEAALTGESLPCSKSIASLMRSTVLAERKNMLYTGTVVVRGDGRGIVIETAMKTEIGKIASMVQEKKSVRTPLQVRLEELGKFLGIFTIFISIVVFGIGLYKKLGVIEMFLTSVSFAVAVIPEGLPAVVTICLALSVQRMIKKKSLIKRLQSIETLGDITYICSDKTGTLTQNEMTVKKMFANNDVIDVGGFGYTTDGKFTIREKEIDAKELELLLEIAASCNNATESVGDPTERALIFVAKKGNVAPVKRIDEIPFDADKKYMATIHEGCSYYKGAPEVILDMCSYIIIDGKLRRLIPKDVERIHTINKQMAENALRVLGFAYEAQKRFVFVGLMGMIDPPKDGVKEALEKCLSAGIKAIMITGDHPLTAKAIGSQIGFDGDILTGQELDKMTDFELRDAVKKYTIYARTTSAHKVRILKALQANGEVVAMTGDGINDAPALKMADVGIAMSLRGTDVARDAADMVLTDDHFASIVDAVEEGRSVYDNIRKFILYLLSANAAEIGVVLFSLLLSMPLPLLPIHLLWVNLMTDSWPALALGVDDEEEDVMKRKPRHPKESFLKDMKMSILLTGILGTIMVLYLFQSELRATGSIVEARTVALTAMISFELIRVFGCKSQKPFQNFLKNKWLNLAVLFSFGLQLAIIYTPLNIPFKVAPLKLMEMVRIIGFSLIPFIIIECYKVIASRVKAQAI